MPRLYWPTMFELDLAFRSEAPNVPSGKLAAALRWRVHPVLGLPREPFKVFRRDRTFPLPEHPLNLIADPVRVDFPTTLDWGVPMMEANLNVTLKPGEVVTFQALDDRREVIPGESRTVQNNGAQPLTRLFTFRTPNLCAFAVTGHATVNKMHGATMEAVLQDPHWILEEVVGLPFTANEVAPAVYSAGSTQGKSQGRPGSVAAIERLTEAKSIYSPPPSPSVFITWPEPAPTDVMSALKIGPNSLFGKIRQMLVDTAPGGVAQGTGQFDYRSSVPVPTFRQPGQQPDPKLPGRMSLGICGLTAVAASSDSWTALALGFGTTMFPNKILPPAPPPKIAAQPEERASPTLAPIVPITLPLTDSDFMVTGRFRLSNGDMVEVGAVATAVNFAVVSPTQLSATQLRRHRPMVRDQVASEDVQLRWLRTAGALRPHQYALLINSGSAPIVLNQPRPGVKTGFIPYAPTQRTDGNSDDQDVVTFVDAARPGILTGTRTDTYMVAAQDVFGRWSQWSEVNYVVKSEAVALPPRMLQASITLKNTMSTGRRVNCDMALVFAIDWADRSPGRMQVVGCFVDPQADPPETPPSGMVLDLPPKGNEGPVMVKFLSISNQGGDDTGGPPLVQLPVQPDDSEVRRYKLTFTFVLDFGTAPRLAFALWGRTSLALDPFSKFGDYSAPVVARANDPLPAPVPTVQPQINWTALPDAAGIARAHLKFSDGPPVPFEVASVRGYAVYEASEAAILSAAGAAQPPKSGPGSTIGSRAIELKKVAGSIKAVDAFARVNTELLPLPSIEVALPGTLDGLYAYTFSSVTTENVESPRSGVVLVAVPRRVVPGAPSLRVRAEAGGVRVRVLPGSGPGPARVALHRTSSPAVIGDIDLMGPPVQDGKTPPWTIASDGSFSLLDPVAPSWRAYHYRAVAYGAEDELNGKRAGRSAPSAVMDVVVPPQTPPDLTGLVFAPAAGGTLLRVQALSSAEIRISPAGVHRLQVLTIDRSGAKPKESLHAESTLPAIPSRTQPPVEATGKITRGNRDGAGRYLYEAFVPKGAQELLVRLIDPLGRSTSQRLSLLPDLVDLDAQGQQSTITVSVRSASPTTAPPAGAYLLELLQESAGGGKPTVTLMGSAPLHTIGTTPAAGKFVRTQPGADGRCTYSFTFGFSPGAPVDKVHVRLTDPLGAKIQLSAAIVSGGGTEL